MRLPDDSAPRRAPARGGTRAEADAEVDPTAEDCAADEGTFAADEAEASTPESERLRELLFDLGRHRSLRDPVAITCEDFQLTPTQMHSVMWLGHDGPTHVGVLAHRAGITKKTITGVVDRLEAMGLVERARDAEDRRAVVARLTPQGQELYTRISQSINVTLCRGLKLLEPSDREALFGMLERLIQRMAKTDPAA